MGLNKFMLMGVEGGVLGGCAEKELGFLRNKLFLLAVSQLDGAARYLCNLDFA